MYSPGQISSYGSMFFTPEENYREIKGKKKRETLENLMDVIIIRSRVNGKWNGAGAARNDSLMSLSQAAEDIDASHLADFLVTVLDDYWSMPQMYLVRLAEYFEDALSQVPFRWVEMFKGASLPTLIAIPLSDIPKRVYETSVEWIKHLQLEPLCAFVLWAFDRILIDLAAQQERDKGGKKVGIFVALAMVLRTEPAALTIVLPMLRDRPRCQGHDKLPVTVWMMAQASQGGLSAGLYSWAHYLLPLVGNNEDCCSAESMDLILGFVENILSNPEIRTILLNGAVREGVRLIQPASFEILVRLTFPDSSASAEATKRFEAIYPLLKEMALAPENATGSNAMKDIFTFSLKLAGEGHPFLAMEATAIAISCVTKNVDCFKHWDYLYEENLEASVAFLKKLADEWKDHSLNISLLPSNISTVNRTMESFRLKNVKAITERGANCSLYKEADKYCKLILRRLSLRSGGLKVAPITAVVLFAGGAVVGAAAALFLR